MNKLIKKSLSVLLSATMLIPCVSYAASAATEEDVISINNPYANVDWDTWQAYKSQIHCHTTASDGYLTIKEAVQLSYDLDYDILSITDHGTLNRGWNVAPDLVPLMRLIKKERTNMSEIVPVSDEDYEAYINGTALKSDGTTRENGMLDVPLGAEQNLATPFADCHLTSYWAEYGQGYAGVFGDYETPCAEVAKLGGVTVLAHVGEYVYINKDSYDHVGQPVDEYYVNKFARLFLDDAGSCVGMGINSATDCHTRCDRILYDSVLMKTIPNGVTPWGFTFSDAHDETCWNDAYTMNYMPELTLDAYRDSMENGTFFGIARYSYGYELDGEPEMAEPLEDSYVADFYAATPLVTNINVNEAENTITVTGTDFNRIVWVADGNVIKREANIENGTATIDLDDYKDSATTFVRFYLTGDCGICYSQPFALTRSDIEVTPVDVPVTNDISTHLRKLVTIVDWLFFKLSPVIWAFKYFAMGYSPFDNFFNF